MKKRLAAIGVAAGLAGGSLVGLTLASPGFVGAQGSTTTTTPGSTTRPDRSARLAETLRPLVEAGTITQAQADAVIQAIEAAGPIGRGGHRGGGKISLDAAAGVLGISVEEVRTALAGGQTLAQLAQSRGIERQAVVDALVAAARASVAERVASGDLTQAEADAKLADIDARVGAAVDGQWSGRGPGHRGRGGDDGDDNPSGSGSTTSTTAGAS